MSGERFEEQGRAQTPKAGGEALHKEAYQDCQKVRGDGAKAAHGDLGSAQEIGRAVASMGFPSAESLMRGLQSAQAVGEEVGRRIGGQN